MKNSSRRKPGPKIRQLILFDGKWGDPRAVDTTGGMPFVSITCDFRPKSEPIMRLGALTCDNTPIVPLTEIPFSSLMKMLNVGAADLVETEWARIFGDDWRDHYRSPLKMHRQYADIIRENSGDEDELVRRSIVFVISLIEMMGYTMLAMSVRRVLESLLGIRGKHWYHKR